MKRTFMILLAVLMTGACSAPQQSVIAKTASPQDTSPSPSSEMQTVTLEGEEHTITFEIPISYTTEEVMLDQAKEILVKEGDIEIISVGTGAFGVCGTGLKQEKMMINDTEAIVGYYDGSREWSFAVFVTGNPAVYALNRIYEGDRSPADMILQSIHVR